MMNIQMTDLNAQYESIKDEIDQAIKEVLNESGFILGKQVSLFEKEVAEYFGVKFAVGVASGTDALVLSLAGLGIKEGDEVITTPFTFIATAEAISRVGARPVFCDIDEKTYNIDAQEISSKINGRVKAIIPVHLYGLPCQMDEILKVAKTNNLKIIEDCAQSFGSEYAGKKAGSFGECGCLSFFPAKTLGCYGDGGMVVTDDEALVANLRMLRNHGSSNKYIYSVHGFNSRLDALQAAVLRVKLKYADKWIKQRIHNAEYYNKQLSGIAAITLPEIPNNSKHSFNYYTILIKSGRENIQERLMAKNIPSAVYYPLCLHLQEVYKDLKYKPGDFPVAEKNQDRVLSLPMYPELGKSQIDMVVKAIKESL
ncbi:MAG: DegT/DnrJ/EryC1/StrS family aminotransferase [Candidatus Omnitrophota bacterium]